MENQAPGNEVFEAMASDRISGSRDVAASRIEKLLEQQNQLMLRHLQLAEQKRAEVCTPQFVFRSRDILKTLDPEAREVFTAWQVELRKKTRDYVAQSKLGNRFQKVTSTGTDFLIKPFADEARKPWCWPDFYLARAKPIASVEAKGDAAITSETYDVQAAFAELRLKHAQESQNFVLAHQKACVEQLSEELKLPRQLESLEERVATLARGGTRRESLETLQHQARCFAELVFREEMSKAEKKIAEDGPSPLLLLAMRILCSLATVITPMALDFERLISLVAVLFALGCGMALFSEETFLHFIQMLLGGLPRYLALLKLYLGQVSSSQSVTPRVSSRLETPKVEEIN